jgi:hypothetical protein
MQQVSPKSRGVVQLDVQPPAQAKGPWTRIRTQTRKSEPGAIPDSRKCGFQAHDPALALIAAQYSQFQIELNGSPRNISQGTPANYEVLVK